MIADQHINRVDCPECDEEQLTQRERISHTINKHEDKYPFSSQYPCYYKCTAHGDNLQDVYLLVETEIGPFYEAYESEDGVDEITPFELIRHEWEVCVREDTPFPEYEK